MVHALKKQSQADFYESEATMVYTVSFGAFGATQSDPGAQTQGISRLGSTYTPW